jgi:predicted permease
VVISHAFWQGQLGGARDVIGRTLQLNNQTLTIIGVTPAGFYGGMANLAFDVWVPATMAPILQPASQELTSRTFRSYIMFATPRAGVTAAQMKAELDAAARQMIAAFPETNKGLGYEAVPLWRAPRGGKEKLATLFTLQVFSFLILVVVCANTASLLLARASVHQREIGVRLAIGAGARRVLGQLLFESVVLALLGAFAGLLLAMWGLDGQRHIPLPSGVPIKFVVEFDAASALFATLVGAACGIAFGLAPALQLARANVLDALRGGRAALAGRSRLRDIVVGFEIAVALIVLVLAGLFLKSFRNSQKANPGFDTEHVMLATVDLAGRGYDQARGQQFMSELMHRLEARPGVARSALAGIVPLDFRGMPTGVIDVEGKAFDPERKILYANVTPGYFATLGVPILEGEDLAPLERKDLPLDAVINDTMAKRFWPEGSPIGKRFEVSGTFYRVAGVARTVKNLTLNEAPRPVAWLTMRAQFIFSPTLHVRAASGDPAALFPTVRAVVHELDPELAIVNGRTMAQQIDNNLFLQRIPARMLSLLAPVALALAAIGLYAVLAFSVAQRTQEIGVRLSLGATPQSVVRLVIWQGLRVVLLGGAVGWIISFALAYPLQGALVGVPPGDPTIYVGVPAILLGVALLACWLPARRAARVDPMVALRSE